MRRRLSIVACPAYAPNDPTPRGERGCERCGHQVHDLTQMTEDELTRLLQERTERVCVYARVRRDGTPVLSRRRMLGGMATAGITTIAACAPHAAELELELPGSLCEDADGFEVSCESEIDHWLDSIPEEPAPLDEPIAQRDEEPELEPDSEKERADDPEVLDIGDVEFLGMMDIDEDFVSPAPPSLGDAEAAG